MKNRNRFIPKLLAVLLAAGLAVSVPATSRAEAPVNTGGSASAVSPVVYYEAESPANAFTGNAAIADCGTCSGGKKAGNLYGGSTLQFNGIQADQAGVYTMTVHYISGDPRSALISVNGAEGGNFNFPKTADWDTVGAYDIQMDLKQGSNTIVFADGGGYSPDIDKIGLRFDAEGDGGPGNDGSIGDLGKQLHVTKYGAVTLTEYQKGIKVSNPSYELLYNTVSGLSQYNWNRKPVIKGGYSAIRLDRTVASTDYKSHVFSKKDVTPFQDATGRGIKVTIRNEEKGLPTLSQIFYIYDRGAYVLTETAATQATALTTNDITPVTVHARGGIDIGSYGDNRVLVTPFDNDSWSRYQAKTINTRLNNDHYVSSELTAIYDNASRKGLVLGSVTHDTWKTGIYWSGSDNKLNELRVYGGFTSQDSTHDSLAHGSVTGKTVTSPKIFIGFYDDYRSGLEGYGQVNAAIAPPLAFGPNIPDGVPVGWNSWGAYADHLSYDQAAAVSKYFKEHLQEQSFSNNGNVYINLDSYWDNMTDEQLSDLVKLIRANGQKAGIYYSPFVYWGDNLKQTVEGTDGKYTYGDIVLRDASGNVLPKLDGAYAVDPTHPGAKMRIDYYMNRFKQEGFEYIKVDFLSHGDMEGKHDDPKVQTGIQAYNQGMAYLDKSVGGTMFISASIAPLFPSQYAHSRRISCDVDGSLGSTEYQLNNLTYGWWQNGTIYHFTDPDYMTLVKGGSYEGAQTRVNAAAISGTVYLNSDDVSNPDARKYMESLLIHPEVNALAVKGKAFKPVEGNTGTKAADSFVLEDKGTYYLAVFNYTGDPATRQIDLKRAGVALAGTKPVQVTDLWTGSTQTSSGTLDVSLKGGESKLYKIVP
ncbi:carbohydrate-binding protein [Paenibacillus sp. HJL G12]|uniref:Carbohydrate-binding protein n=1 Tax=Paenibacillus dendrobii TaxID=2691084 RepID=A0A7X3LL35_9BACL|nr:carbohydrate-binding protein [Paenibacillus dendrobii]MWV47213.1 carbohydrate-binding protein [Paenibacillus dendrobii]